MFDPEYNPIDAAILRGQNEQRGCPSCGAISGHFGRCAILKGTWDTTSIRSVLGIPEFTEQDHILAHALGVQL